MIDLDNFCSAPFKSALVDKDGSLIPCCEFIADKSTITPGNILDFATWWQHSLQPMRDAFTQGTKDSGCLHCDKQEKVFDHQNGHRKFQNQSAVYPLNFYATRPTNSIEQLEIRFGNYCNLKCIMCGEYASSSISSEYIKYQKQYNEIGVFMSTAPVNRWWENSQSLSNLEAMLPLVQKCVFSGGEPLIVPEVLRILDLIDDNCNLVFISNLTKLTDALLQKLARFKSVSINVSCEGIGAHNDYIRAGSKWDTIQSNIFRLQQCKNIKITVSHVLQHTSIFSLPLLINWCHQNSLYLSLGLVYDNSYPGPGVLGINSAHPTDVAAFKTCLGPHKIPDVTNWLNQYSYNPALNQKFHEYTNMLDSIRGTNFKETFNPTYD